MGRKKHGLTKEIILDKVRDNQMIMINNVGYSLNEFYSSEKLIRQLVIENPEFAHQLYCRSENEKLGRIFVSTYNGLDKWGAEAFHIGTRIGIIGIEKPHSRLREEVEKFEYKLTERKRYGIYRGTREPRDYR